MFGTKKEKPEPVFDNEGYEQTYEYTTLAIIGIVNLNKELNIYARKGWELVNGCMAGTTHYAYLRRRMGGAHA